MRTLFQRLAQLRINKESAAGSSSRMAQDTLHSRSVPLLQKIHRHASQSDRQLFDQVLQHGYMTIR